MLTTESERFWFLMGLVTRGRINTFNLPSDTQPILTVGGVLDKSVDVDSGNSINIVYTTSDKEG